MASDGCGLLPNKLLNHPINKDDTKESFQWGNNLETKLWQPEIEALKWHKKDIKEVNNIWSRSSLQTKNVGKLKDSYH